MIEIKGPNPFAPWERTSIGSGMYGRKEEIRIFESFINATTSKQAGVIIVTGPLGVGKTMLLHHFKQQAESTGIFSVEVKVENSEDEESVVNKIYQETALQSGGIWKGRSGVGRGSANKRDKGERKNEGNTDKDNYNGSDSDSYNESSTDSEVGEEENRLNSRSNKSDKFYKFDRFDTLFEDMTRVQQSHRNTASMANFSASVSSVSDTGGTKGALPGTGPATSTANTGFGTILFIDDFDNIKKAEAILSRILRTLKAGRGKKRISLVLSSTHELKTDSELAQHMDLKEFDEHEVRELIEAALGKGPPKMGDECINAILGDTNGNPRLVKNVCYYIYDRLRDNDKLITKGHYLAYLPWIMSMLSREWFGRMYQEVPKSELDVLQIIAKSDGEIHVSDVAKRTGKKLGPVTALTKRLLDRGQIVRRGRGRYRIFSKLYAKYIISRNTVSQRG